MTVVGNKQKEECLKICYAFRQFIKEYQITWPSISDYVKASKLSMGASVANLQGYFGVGGEKRSQLLKSAVVNRKFYESQISIIKEVNKHINPSIAFSMDGNALLFDSENNFIPHFSEGKSDLTEVAKEEFIGFYWRHDNLLGSTVLTLYKSQSSSAELEVIYTHKEKNICLKGDYTNLKGAYMVRLHDKFDKPNSPLTQITFLRSPEADKDCYFAGFCTAHRGASTFPVSGAMLLVKKERYNELQSQFRLEDFAAHFLRNKRFKVSNSGFDIRITSAKAVVTDDADVNNYLEIVKYEGIYTGEFINPKKYTYETCVIKVTKTTEVEMMVQANVQSRPFHGIARLHKRKVLLISYDFMDEKEEMKDYRMKLIFDVSRYQLKNETIDGLMNGLELETGEPMSSTICIRRIKKGDHDISKFKKEIKVLYLADKKNFRSFEKGLKEKGVYDFFFGRRRDNFTSIGLLNVLLKRNL